MDGFLSALICLTHKWSQHFMDFFFLFLILLFCIPNIRRLTSCFLRTLSFGWATWRRKGPRENREQTGAGLLSFQWQRWWARSLTYLLYLFLFLLICPLPSLPFFLFTASSPIPLLAFCTHVSPHLLLSPIVADTVMLKLCVMYWCWLHKTFS